MNYDHGKQVRVRGVTWITNHAGDGLVEQPNSDRTGKIVGARFIVEPNGDEVIWAIKLDTGHQVILEHATVTEA